jgi:uncharacterized protein involved in exopolysaccharide biosynthesis/Mrp family chromosome partitioning ATPase
MVRDDQPIPADTSFEASPPVSERERAIDVGALGRHLWARRWRILIPTLLAAVIAAVAVNMVTPYYSSEARLLIESGQTVFNRPQSEQGAGDERSVVEPEAVQSQVQVILSRDLARQVVRDLKLDERPEFAPQPGFVSRLLGMAGIRREASQTTREDAALAVLAKNLNVYNFERSRVIAIDYSSPDPELSARIANAFAEDYLKLQQISRANATRQSTQWLATEIEALRTKVADAEAKVEAFRSKANLYVGANGTTLTAQQLGELSTQLTSAQTQKAEAESKAAAIRAQLRNGGAIEVSEVLNSDLIRALVERRIMLRAALAEQSATLLARHPRIKELRAQIADLDGQIRAEAMTMVRSFEDSAKLAGARVDAVSNQLDQIKQQATTAGGQDVELRALEREARSQRDLLESFLGRYRDAASRSDPASVQPDARIISMASAAIEPTYPKKLPIILMAALAMMLLAAALSAIGVLMAAAPSEDDEPDAPSPVPGPVQGDGPHHLPWIGSPGSDVPEGGAARAEAKRENTLADLSRLVELRGEGARLVIVTGPEPDEGVARCALALARSLAASELRVVLVCLDVSSEALNALGLDERAPGLTDLLFAVASFSETIHRDSASRSHLIPPGRGSRDADGLVAADRLILILSALAQTYDHVVVAAPPLGMAVGAGKIAALKPTVILVTRPDGSATDAVEAFDTLAARGFGEIAMVTFARDQVAIEPVAEEAA